MNALRHRPPPRGPYPRDIISHTRTLAAPGARCHSYRVVNVVQLTIRDLAAVARVVDDPYTFGAIAAANAMSDVYAMGGEVVLALNIAGFPDDLPPSVVTDIFRGGADKVAEAGGVRLGELVTISEGTAARPVIPFARGELAVPGAGPGPVETGQLEVSVTVEARHWIDR